MHARCLINSEFFFTVTPWPVTYTKTITADEQDATLVVISTVLVVTVVIIVIMCISFYLYQLREIQKREGGKFQICYLKELNKCDTLISAHLIYMHALAVCRNTHML